MTITQRDEKRLLTEDEFDTVARTHYPDICDLGRKELAEHQKRLRDMRDKARSTSRQQRREVRGKAAPRGSRPATDNSGTARKEQVFVSAIKRVNREISRFAKAEGNESQRETLLRALEQKRAARKQNHPRAGRTAHGHMSATPDPGKHPKVDPSPSGG